MALTTTREFAITAPLPRKEMVNSMDVVLIVCISLISKITSATRHAAVSPNPSRASILTCQDRAF